MRKIFFVILATICLTGCLERIGQIDRNLKPYGAHWIKDGMTREMRLNDLESCGNSKSLSSGFSDALIRAETLPTDVVSQRSYDKNLIDNPQAEARLGKKRMACMQSKGYSWLEQCDARCLHP